MVANVRAVLTVTFYADASGHKPVADYLRALPAPERARLAEALWRIQAYGLSGSGVATRQLEGKLWEVKVSAQRAFYVLVTSEEMVVLHAYTKKSQRAPRSEIDLALRRMKEVLGE